MNLILKGCKPITFAACFITLLISLHFQFKFISYLQLMSPRFYKLGLYFDLFSFDSVCLALLMFCCIFKVN